jgi:hypothetical protein
MNNTQYAFKQSKAFLAMFTILCFSGCATDPYGVQPALGKSVRDAMAQQTLNPDSARQRYDPSGTDGVILKSAIDRYQTSYEVPPPPVNVMNIGLGSSSGTSGR